MHALRTKLIEAIAATPAAKAANVDAAAVSALLAPPPKAGMGDLALPCFQFSKALGCKPPEAAARLLSELRADSSVTGASGLCSNLAALGPYLNFTFNTGALANAVLGDVFARSCKQDDIESWHYGESTDGHGDEGKPRVCVIDLSSPNIAKPLGVHHLRSTMIGNSLKRLHEASGWVVVGVNHLGDWGTGFGKLIAGFCEAYPAIAKEFEAAPDPSPTRLQAISASLSISDLNRVYVEFNKKLEANPALEDAGRREFAELERATLEPATLKDSAQRRRNQRLWVLIRHISIMEFERVYRLLGLEFAHFPSTVLSGVVVGRDLGANRFVKKHCLYIGESHYVRNPAFFEAELTAARASGHAVESQGALVMFVDGPDQPPLMLMKTDGATSYHTRDMASATFRHDEFRAARLLYVVGNEQSLHFRQLFRAMSLVHAGFDWEANTGHIGFGLYLSHNEAEGKWEKLSTRKGRSILLHDLLDEAIEAVRGIVREKNPELAAKPEKLEKIARAVGVGAIIFNDLKNGRRSDVKFDWDEMLSFHGETGPYMLYQYVRLLSVRRKFEATYGVADLSASGAFDPALLTLPQERELLNQLAAFPEAVRRATREFEPSVISRYLLDLSGLFSTYWTATKGEGIVGENRALSTARIALVEATRRVLGKGLTLLGLSLVDEM